MKMKTHPGILKLKTIPRFAQPYSRYIVNFVLCLRANPDASFEDIRFRGHKLLLDKAHKVLGFQACPDLATFKRIIWNDAQLVLNRQTDPLNDVLNCDMDGGNGLSFMSMAGIDVFKLQFWQNK